MLASLSFLEYHDAESQQFWVYGKWVGTYHENFILSYLALFSSQNILLPEIIAVCLPTQLFTIGWLLKFSSFPLECKLLEGKDLVYSVQQTLTVFPPLAAKHTVRGPETLTATAGAANWMEGWMLSWVLTPQAQPWLSNRRVLVPGLPGIEPEVQNLSPQQAMWPWTREHRQQRPLWKAILWTGDRGQKSVYPCA